MTSVGRVPTWYYNVSLEGAAAQVAPWKFFIVALHIPLCWRRHQEALILWKSSFQFLRANHKYYTKTCPSSGTPSKLPETSNRKPNGYWKKMMEALGEEEKGRGGEAAKKKKQNIFCPRQYSASIVRGWRESLNKTLGNKERKIAQFN